MKKFNVVSLVVVCFMSLLIFVYDLEIVDASDNEENAQAFFEPSNLSSSPLVNEDQSGIEIRNEMLAHTLSARFVGINATVWLRVSTSKGGVPSLDKYWHVTYLNGKKYQGYVYWTGRSTIENWGPPVRWVHQFSGNLALA